MAASEAKLNMFRMTSMSPAQMKQQANAITALYKMVNGNNTWGGSKNGNYTNMVNKLKALKTMADGLVKSGATVSKEDTEAFKGLANEVSGLAERYMENKTNRDSNYAKKQYDNASEVMDCMHALAGSIDDAAKTTRELTEKRNKFYLEVHDVYDPLAAPINPFYGDSYSSVGDSRKIFGENEGLSHFEMAGISFATLAIAMEGNYTMEDLLDATKLTKEKADMFDKVVTAMKSQSPKDKEWLSEIATEGTKAGKKLVNEMAKDVDFAAPGILTDPRLHMMDQMCLHMGNVSPEEKAMFLPLGGIGKELANRHAEAMKASNGGKDFKDGLTNVAVSTIQQTAALKEIAKMQKANPDVPLTDLLAAPDTQMKMKALSGDAAKEALGSIGQHLNFVANDPKTAQYLVEPFLAGGCFRKVSVKVGPDSKVSYSNFPSEKELQSVAKDGQFLMKSDEACQRMQTNKYTDRDAFHKDSGYVLFGQSYRITGGIRPFKASTGKEMSLNTHLNNMVRNKAFDNVLRSKENPKKYMSPAKIASMSRDPKRMKGLINESRNKYQEMRAAKKKAATKAVKKTTVKKKEKKLELKKPEAPHM